MRSSKYRIVLNGESRMCPRERMSSIRGPYELGSAPAVERVGSESRGESKQSSHAKYSANLSDESVVGAP